MDTTPLALLFFLALLLVCLSYRAARLSPSRRLSAGKRLSLGKALLLTGSFAGTLVATTTFSAMAHADGTPNNGVLSKSAFSGDPFTQAISAPATNTAYAAATPRPITADELITQASFLLMTNPQGTMQSLKRLGQSPQLNSLLNDPDNQQVLSRGNPEEIAELPEYQQLQQNPDVLMLFSQYQADDPRLASLLATYWQRSQQLQNNPEFQAVMEDPIIQEQLQAGNPLPLLTHPKGLQLLRSLLNSSASVTPAP